MHSSKALWTLLFYAGYLKATDVAQVDLDYACQLAIPNEEVKCTYRTIFREWLEHKIGDSNYQSLLVSLSKGHVELFVERLNEFLVQSASFRDFTRESDYHCFVLGLISGMMHTYQVVSNKEQGFGFSDLTLIPLDKKNPLGLILEFKHIKLKEAAKHGDEEATLKAHHDQLKAAAEGGLRQIAERNYRSIFSQSHHEHVEVVLELGMAFLGKSVAVAYKKYQVKTNELLSSDFLGG